MRRTSTTILLLLIPIMGCAQTPVTAVGALSERAAEYRISNGVLSLGICQHDAGAVCSIVYDGHEFVNDHDHGRQMQVAWSYNDLGGAYNPTEAGSDDDFKKPSSTSELLGVRVDAASLVTVSHPAYWMGPRKGRNTDAVTKDTLTKTITLGYGNDP